MTFRSAMPHEDLWIGEMRGVRIAGQRILLLRLEDGVRAYEDRCAHLGVPLSEGTLEGCVIRCRAHHYEYDACTGAGVNPRATRLVPVGTRVVHGQIQVDLPDASPGTRSVQGKPSDAR